MKRRKSREYGIMYCDKAFKKMFDMKALENDMSTVEFTRQLARAKDPLAKIMEDEQPKQKQRKPFQF